MEPQSPRKLDPDDFKEYLNSEPLEPPSDMSFCDALCKGASSSDYSDMDTFLRKAARLLLEAMEKSDTVRHYLEEAEAQHDSAYENLLSAVENRTPKIWDKLGEMAGNDMAMGWAVFNSAKYLIGE